MEGLVVGIDFGGPAKAGQQRRKIVSVAAKRIHPKRYEVTPESLNARLLASPPGWTALELAEALIGSTEPMRLVATDFPFSLPASLLNSVSLAELAGHAGAFQTWKRFNEAVQSRLPLTCPVRFEAFGAWRNKEYWVKRATDTASGAQPPLKHQFQVLFNMTLLGNAFLARLEASGRFDVAPFQRRGRPSVVEVYPGHAMRKLGVPDYKHAPGKAIDALLRHMRSVGVEMTVAAEVRATCESYDSGGAHTNDFDAADALVAAGIAALCCEGLAIEVLGDPGSARDIEGAIWSL